MTDPTIIDTPNTPTLFVEGIRGMQIRDGVAVLNLTEHVYPANGLSDPEYDKTVVRLAMSISAFVRMSEWFADTTKGLLEQGVVVKTEANGGSQS